MLLIILVMTWTFYSAHSYPVGRTDTVTNGVATVQSRTYNSFILYFLIVLFIILILICIIFSLYYCCKDRFTNLSQYQRISNQHIVPDGPTGLQNRNETCYMNSMIQAIAASNKLLNQYDELVMKCNDQKLKMFVNLLKNVNEPCYNGHTLERNTEELGRLIKTIKWGITSQQDTFQMLSHFINSIQKTFKEFLLTNKMTMPPKFELLHTFSENSSYNKIQDHLALALPLVGSFTEKPGVFIESLLDAFFEPSHIDDGTYTTTMYLYGKAPDVLILHIQANEWNNDRGEYVKPKYYIKYGEILRYVFSIQRNKDGSELDEVTEEYRLVAVVHHMGGVSGGHYITYRMHRGEWYLTNDEQVEKIRFNNDVVPYVMVYEKITL